MSIDDEKHLPPYPYAGALRAYLADLPEGERASALIRLRASFACLAEEAVTWRRDGDVPDTFQARATVCLEEILRSFGLTPPRCDCGRPVDIYGVHDEPCIPPAI